MTKKVIILRGISGSGKSTYIEKNHPTAFTCSADHYFYNKKGEYNFDPKLLGHAHKSCKKNFFSAIEQGESPIIVDNTNTQFWEMKTYIEAAENAGYEIEFVRMETKVDIAAARNAHGVPVEVVKRMHDRMEELPDRLKRKEKIIKNNLKQS